MVVIWSAETMRAVRSGRAVVLLGLYSMFSLVLLLGLGSIANNVNRRIAEQLGPMGGDAETTAMAATELKKGFLGLLAGEDAAMLEAMAQVPLVVLLVFKLTLFFLPLYVALMGFDQISGEVGPRSIRYLTVRARRSSLLMGKFLSQASLLVGLVLIIDLAIFVYAKATNADFTPRAMAFNLLKYWLAAIVFSLAWLALTTLCSSLFRAPAVSLVFNLLVLFVFWLMDVVGDTDWAARNALGWVRFLSPSYYAADLLHPRLAQFGLSGLAYVGFAALFLGGAYGVLRTRDL